MRLTARGLKPLPTAFETRAQPPAQQARSTPINLAEFLRRPGRRGVPKYVRLGEALLELIRSGHWKPGDKLPSEDQIVSDTPFSLGTVQRALRDLVDKKILVRQQGRGTFVAELPRRMDTPWHCQFVDDSGSGFLPLFSKAIERKLITARGPWSTYIGNSASHYLQIDRIVSVNNEFVVYGRFYCDPAVLRYFAECPLGKLSGLNFVHSIVYEQKIPLTNLSHYVSLIEFTTNVAKIIDVRPGTIGMLATATGRSQDGNYIYYQEFFIPQSGRKLFFSEDFEVTLHA
jgi:GntR family transcriptional regulator